MEAVGTERAHQLWRDGAQFVEVLPPSAYAVEHIPGAVNLPLPQLDVAAAEALDRSRPVVVYCYDHECDLSARGAALLERYGFAPVYDYAESKTAWLGRGLPVEGTLPDDQRAGGRMRPAATCGPGTSTAELPEPGPGGVVVVVDDAGRVLGAVRPEAAGSAAVAVLDVLQPGPVSVRPSIPVEELAASMDGEGQGHVLVTTYDGVLLGVVDREDLHVDR